MNGKKIGFAEQYYTLWEFQKRIEYFTDCNGNAVPSHEVVDYFYIKNVSMDIDKVTEQYPDLEIDENLRGVSSRRWTLKKEKDLSPHILKFGKYSGHNIFDIMETDMKYAEWVADNAYNQDLRNLILESDKYQKHISQKKLDYDKLFNEIHPISDGKVELEFLSNAYMEMGHGAYAAKARKAYSHENLVIFVTFDKVKPVRGLYPYNMPYINGKAVRLKNKIFELDITIQSQMRGLDYHNNPEITQYVKANC